MTSASAVQFAAVPVRMGVYERPAPAPVMGMWNSDPFKVDSGQATSGSTVMEADKKFDNRVRKDELIDQLDFLHGFCDLSIDGWSRVLMLMSFVQLEDVPQVALEPARSTDQETSRPPERVQFKDLSLVFLFVFLTAAACLVFLKYSYVTTEKSDILSLNFDSPFHRLFDLLLQEK